MITQSCIMIMMRNKLDSFFQESNIIVPDIPETLDENIEEDEDVEENRNLRKKRKKAQSRQIGFRSLIKVRVKVTSLTRFLFLEKVI